MARKTEKTWRCSICGYLHDGAAPPERCPICDATSDDFREIESAVRLERRIAGKEKILIVGAGIAGVSAAEAAREHAPQAEIILLSGEEELPYQRLNLTRLLAGEFKEKDLPLHNQAWYETLQIKLLRGVQAEKLVLAEKAVRLQDGQLLQFDKLILATGSHPFIPPITGTDLPGVITVRTAADVRRILEVVEPDLPVACIGGGILGLETAGALAKQGARVTVLESFDYLMPMQLNPEGSRVLQQHLKTLRIDVITQSVVERILGDDAASGVQLKDGRKVPATMVIITAGDRANAELPEQAGLPVRKGVLVDNYLRTSHPDIYAAGDVAEHDGIRYGSWAPAMYMGKIAGRNAAGIPTEFGGIPRSHVLKVLGKPMLSIGTICATDGSYRMIEDHADNGYRLFMFRDGRLVGSLLIGKLKLMKPIRKAIQARLDLHAFLTEDTTAEDVAQELMRQQ